MAEDKKTADVYARIYGSCQDSLLFRTMLAVVKQALSYAQERGHVEHSFICGNERWGGLNKVKGTSNNTRFRRFLSWLSGRCSARAKVSPRSGTVLTPGWRPRGALRDAHGLHP